MTWRVHESYIKMLYAKKSQKSFAIAEIVIVYSLNVVLVNRNLSLQFSKAVIEN